MYFDSLSALWAMEGHGPFVWSAYGICLLVMVGLIVFPVRRQRAYLRDIRNRAQRQR